MPGLLSLDLHLPAHRPRPGFCATRLADRSPTMLLGDHVDHTGNRGSGAVLGLGPQVRLAAEVSSDTACWRVLTPPGTCRCRGCWFASTPLPRSTGVRLSAALWLGPDGRSRCRSRGWCRRCDAADDIKPRHHLSAPCPWRDEDLHLAGPQCSLLKNRSNSGPTICGSTTWSGPSRVSR